jgi:SOS-response transcriptional repressor LexA
VIVKKTDTAENGDIVVCVNNGEVLIKKIKRDNKIILVSLNSNYEPFIASDNLKIEGVVKGVLSYSVG